MPDTYEKYVVYCRIIASFAYTGLNPRTNLAVFLRWLRHLGLSKEEIKEIKWIVTNGKLELEDDVELFIKENGSL